MAALECVILIGIPGAGKTTFYRSNLAGTYTHISKDLWPNVRAKDVRQAQALTEAFSHGYSVVVDNTSATVREREAIITIARAHGARVIGYFFDLPVRTALARNAGRTGRARVPAVAIHTIAKRLERPTLSEGFDALFSVRDADGETKVETI
jgi:predicted kinase